MSDVEQLAHDLRAPLNGIRSWVAVLENLLVESDPMVSRALDGILLGVQEQSRLIDKLEGRDP